MPPLQPVVGRAPLYARDPATGDVYEIGGAGASEVAISSTDPYATTGATDELWLDTSTNPPVLKGRVGGAWVVVSSEPPQPEVIVGGTIPAPGDDKLWLDPGGVMTPPTPGDPIKKLWAYDGSVGPTQGWHAVEMGSSEVEVLDTEPDAVNPEWELWVDTAPSIHPIPTDEVWVGPTDPRITYPGNVSDLWLDTTLVPPILKVWNSEAATPAWVTVGYLPLSGGVMNANAHITMGTGGQIKFPNVTAAKILLYSTNFGLGVDSGTLALFAPSANKIAFRADNYNGGEWGYVNSSGMHMVGNRHFTADTDGYGFMMNSGGGIYKRSGSGVTIRKHSGNTMIGIEQNDGSGRKDILVASGAQTMGTHQNVTFTSHLVMSGSNGTNSTHLYVDCDSNADNYHFGVLEARRQNGTVVWKMTGYQNPDSHAKIYVNKGTEGVDEIWQATDYGDGQSMLQVHGPCKATHFHDVNRSSAVAGTMAPIDTDLAGRLIDAVRPVTFDRTFHPEGMTSSNEPGFVRPHHDPIQTIGLDVIDRAAPLADRLVGREDGEYSLGGMLAVAIAEIQSLRKRVAELEGTVA